MEEKFCGRFWQILADFVADSVAVSTKPLDNQGA